MDEYTQHVLPALHGVILGAGILGYWSPKTGFLMLCCGATTQLVMAWVNGWL